MKAEFQRWYEAVQLTQDQPVMEARWAAVQALAKSVSDAELEALVGAAFRSDQITLTSGTVRAKFADKGVAMLDEEFSLLAAATIAAILLQDEPAAARAATMVGTALFGGLRTIRQPIDLAALGASKRLALARTTRRRPPMELEPMPSLAVDTAEPEAAEDCDHSIRLLAGAFSGVLQQLADRQLDFEQRALRYIRIQDEELDMLWWLQGGCTQSGQLFSAISREHKPFVLARDLAEVTFALPGASAIGSLFERAGIDDGEPVEIAAAIQDLPIEWLRKALPDADKQKSSPVTTPVHEGIKRRLEVRGENTWMAGWAGVCDIDAAARLTPLQLADLCYCEQLLIHK